MKNCLQHNLKSWAYNTGLRGIGNGGSLLCAGELGNPERKHTALCFHPGHIYSPNSGRVSTMKICMAIVKREGLIRNISILYPKICQPQNGVKFTLLFIILLPAKSLGNFKYSSDPGPTLFR
jgi:hypothetical protein